MRNPLRKRLLRELKEEAGKYAVIFLLMILSIGFISGFLVADNSMITAYNNSFEDYNIEDGHFETQKEMNRAQRKAVSALGIEIHDLYYVDEPLHNESTMRLFASRTEVNRVCLMKGRMPETAGEIAIDRMYADNNGLSIGDTLESDLHRWTITGLVALSDYSTLFSDNSDSMFDSIKFGVAVISPEEFERCSREQMHFVYAWKYQTPPENEEEASDMSEDLMKQLAREIKLRDFVPRHLNQAIMFTGDDMGSDRVMMMILLYIIIVIMAFVMAITITNTIAKEAGVIGTLRASGYTRGELVRHYMAMPLLVTVISAVIGNILGYTVFKDVSAALYYNSYSLPTYVTLWNADAFLLTTVVPLLLMAAVNRLILQRSLRLSPLKFLRRELSRRKNRRAFRLSPHIRFFARFRIRVLFQNMSNYLLLLVGILFSNFLLMFGLLFPSVLDHYTAHISDNLLCKYQYLLTIPLDALDEEHKLRSLIAMMEFADGVETENEDAEKFSIFTLKTTDERYMIEDVMLYGVEPDSRYIRLADGVSISSAFADKDEITLGDTVTLKEAYGNEVYSFRADQVYPYDGALAIFMDRAELNGIMGEDPDYFCGYLSDTEITDIDEKYIGSVITLEDLTKISRQLDVSMGGMMVMVDGFAMIIFMILIYLLSKIVIEKNAQAISMTKILGYSGREISRLYILPTTLAVIVFLLISLPAVEYGMRWIFRFYVVTSIAGWIPYYLDPKIFAEMFLLGIGTYALVALLENRRLRRVPMDLALKNVE
ncbi:MAG: ABC transporter permease [Oscillospiraceae bacterium]|nr:ABC transporter permease [Oscillospiraceae bacterium]